MVHCKKKDYRVGFYNLLSFFKDNRKYDCIYKILNSREEPLYLYIYSEFLYECQKRNLEKNQEQKTWRFLSSGIQAIISDWSQNEYKESIEEIIDIFMLFVDKI